MNVDVVKELTFPNLKEFLEFVNPVDKVYEEKSKNFIYRGERTTDFTLLPSILRKYPVNVLDDLCYPIPQLKGLPLYEHLIINKEVALLRDFYINADLEGLRIPESNMFRKNIVDKFFRDFDREREFIHDGKWIPQELHEIAGIAQHYGLPTRLIDWTYSYLIALFFATNGVLKYAGKKFKEIQLDEKNDQNLYFVIWMLNINEIIKLNNKDISIIRPIYANNRNLKAQKGLFTTQPFISLEDDKIAFDDFIKKLPSDNNTLLYKIKIPQNRAYEIMVYLDSQSINAKSLFPGFEGVTDYVKWTKNISHL